MLLFFSGKPLLDAPSGNGSGQLFASYGPTNSIERLQLRPITVPTTISPDSKFEPVTEWSLVLSIASAWLGFENG